MSEQQPAGAEVKTGRCMKHNWVEERAVARLLGEEKSGQIHKQGHKGIITLNKDSNLESVTTYKENYDRPKDARVMPRNLRREYLEKHLTLMRRDVITEVKRRLHFGVKTASKYKVLQLFTPWQLLSENQPNSAPPISERLDEPEPLPDD